MKGFNEIEVDLDKEQARQPEMTNEQIALTEKIINNIFYELKGMIPANSFSWTDKETVSRSKEQWFKTFVESSLSNIDLIENGLKKCRRLGLKYLLPPGEFVSYCTPEPSFLGAPTHAVAYKEAVRRSHPCYNDETWSHKAVYHSWIETGARALLDASGPYQIKEVRDIFFSKYDLALKMLSNGEKLREIPKLIDKPKLAMGVTKQGSDALSSLKKLLR
jgi:hypothetical protein